MRKNKKSLKKLPSKVKEILRKKKWKKETVLIGAQDEGRFGRINIPKKSWCPKPQRPKVARQIVRQAVYAYTFVCPEKAKTTSLILPYPNTEMMNLFLKQVSKDFKNYKIIIQVDQAAWHKSKTLKIPKNIALVEQPPYSPELNPVEQIWAEIREKFLDNKLFESMDILTEKLSEALKEIDRYGKKLVSLTSFPHLKGLIQNAN